MARRSEHGSCGRDRADLAALADPTDLATLDDEALIEALAQALGRARVAAGLALPDPAALLAEARRLLAHWDAQLYGACCTDDAAYVELRHDLTDVAHVAEVLLVDTLTDALTAASHLPRAATRLMAAFVVKHGFDAGRGLACPAWARFAAVAAGATPATP